MVTIVIFGPVYNLVQTTENQRKIEPLVIIHLYDRFYGTSLRQDKYLRVRDGQSFHLLFFTIQLVESD